MGDCRTSPLAIGLALTGGIVVLALTDNVSLGICSRLVYEGVRVHWTLAGCVVEMCTLLACVWTESLSLGVGRRCERSAVVPAGAWAGPAPISQTPREGRQIHKDSQVGTVTG